MRCDTCTLLFRNPRERADEIVRTYRDEQPDPHALQALFDNQKLSYRSQVARLTGLAGDSGSGIEIGSYVGGFLHAAKQSGWNFGGIDVNEAANAFARSKGFVVHSGTIDQADPDARVDAVAFWNCFDQLPDPQAAIRAARVRLRDGGWVAIRVPNGAFYDRWHVRLHSAPAIMHALARAALAHNNLLTFPYRHGFSVPALTSLLDRSAFATQHVFGDSLVPLADRWTRRWARAEERLVRSAMRTLPAPAAPWIEVYARAV